MSAGTNTIEIGWMYRGCATRLTVVLAALLALIVSVMPAQAHTASDRWVQSFWSQAQQAGISSQTYWAALGDFEPDPTVVPRATNQPEFVRPIREYLDAAVSE